MAEDNNNTQNATNNEDNAAEQNNTPVAENAVAHGGIFGSDQTMTETADESTENRS